MVDLSRPSSPRAQSNDTVGAALPGGPETGRDPRPPRPRIGPPGSSPAARWEYLLLVALFLLSMTEMLVVPPYIHGDGVGYFAYLRSAFFDGDLHFANEYLQYGQITTLQMLDWGPTPTGLVYNIWSVGPALLWSPFYLGGHLAALALGRFGWQANVDGYSDPYVYSVALGSAVYTFAGLLLTYRLCRRRFELFPSLVALATVWFATSLTAYMYFHPSLSHPISFFLVAGFFSLWWGGRISRPLWWWPGLGLLIGLMAATRLQNALFLLPVAAYEAYALLSPSRAGSGAIPPVRRTPFPISRRRLLSWTLLAGAALLALAPQMFAWWTLYGKVITGPYAEAPGGANFAWTNPRVWDVLFSSKHGLLSWTPAVGLAIAGLVPLALRGDALARVLGLAFLIQLYLVGAWSNWWQGASFSGRMFIELTPVFALGLAELVTLARRRVGSYLPAAMVAILALWNALLMLQYGTGMLPTEDYVDWGVLVANQFGPAPEKLLRIAAPALERMDWPQPLVAGAIALALALLASLSHRPGRSAGRR